MKQNLVFLLLVFLVINCKKDEVNPAVKVTGVSVSPSIKTLMVGETFNITATVSPANADNKVVSWSSSNTTVADVNNSGSVTAKDVGISTITATTADGNKTSTCEVTVQSKVISVTGVTVEPGSMTLTVGDSFTITASVMPVNADNKKVEWKSSDSKIATIDATGKGKALDEGIATITVTTEDGRKVATTNITVNQRKGTGGISDVIGNIL